MSFGYQSTLIVNFAKLYHFKQIATFKLKTDDQMIQFRKKEKSVERWIFVLLMLGLLYEALYVLMRQNPLTLLIVDSILVFMVALFFLICSVQIFSQVGVKTRFFFMLIFAFMSFKIALLPSFVF
jgi:hypothetical protein